MSRRGRGRPRFPIFRKNDRSAGHRAQPLFWILSAFLVLVFATGGSSRADVPFLFILRPAAILMAAYGVSTMHKEHMVACRYPLALAGAILVLTIAHLVPLPPAIWHGLPGRDLVQAIDAKVGLAGQWRPISLVPSKTLNALYALSVPVSTVIVAAQLDIEDRVRTLRMALLLSCVSALVGLLQAAGIPISLYHSVGRPQTIEAAGLFANQNHQAALLAAMIPMMAIMVQLHSRQGRSVRLLKPLIAAGIVTTVILLIVTGSRSGLALGVIALGFTLFYGLLQIDWLDRMSTGVAAGIKLAAGAGLVVIATAVTVLASRGMALNRLETLGSDLRPKLWASIVPILPGYQPWGTGIGSYVEVYRWHEPMALLRETYSNHAHNEYLEIALTAGIPGLLLLLVAAIMTIVTLWRHRRGVQPATLLARLGATIIVILACASITDYPLRTPLLSTVFALAATWCTAPVSRRSRADAPA